MANGVSPVLAIIGRDLLGMHSTVGKIEKGFGAWTVAIGGVAAALGGAGILGILKKTAEHGEKLLDQQDQLRRAGLEQNEVLKLQKNYYDNVAKAVPTSMASEYLKTIKELRAVTGSTEEAEKLAPKALMVDKLLSNTFGTEMHGEYYKLLRAEEMKGISTDEKKREAFTDAAFSYITAFGGKLKAQDYQTLARRGGAAFINMKPEAMGPMSVLTADLGGDAAGTAMMTFQQLATGASTMTKQQGEMWNRLGLINMNKVSVVKGSGRLQLGLGALKGSQEYSGDQPGWVKNVLYPAIVKGATHNGKVNQNEVEEIIGKLAPNRNANKMIHMFGQEGFQDQIMKDLGIAGQVKTIPDAYKDFIEKNPKGVKSAFNQQYESMMEAIGNPVMQAAIPVMRAVTEFFTNLGKLSNSNPEAIAQVAKVMAALGVGLIAIGGLALASLIAMPIAIGGAITAVTAFAALNWGAINTGVTAMMIAINDFITFLMDIPGKIADIITRGLFSSSGKPKDEFDKSLEDANKNYVPMRFNPGKSELKAQPISFSLNVDGRMLAQTISEQLTYLYEHATGAPSPNNQSLYPGADGGAYST